MYHNAGDGTLAASITNAKPQNTKWGKSKKRGSTEGRTGYLNFRESRSFLSATLEDDDENRNSQVYIYNAVRDQCTSFRHELAPSLEQLKPASLRPNSSHQRTPYLGLHRNLKGFLVQVLYISLAIVAMVAMVYDLVYLLVADHHHLTCSITSTAQRGCYVGYGGQQPSRVFLKPNIRDREHAMSFIKGRISQ